MESGTLERPLESEESNSKDKIEGLSLLSLYKESLPAAGRLCLELALAQEDDAPIAGIPHEISTTLEQRTEFDHKTVSDAIHDIIHEDPQNITRAEIKPDETGKTSLVLTPDGVQYLRDEIAKLSS